MSKSEQLLPLVVSSADAGVRITVVDATLAPVAEGVGELHLDLPPGLYACRFQAGASVREQLVSLTPGGSETHVHQDPIEFSSAAPLAKTRTDDADQGNAAAELSRHVHRRVGSGGQLLLFVRDLDHRARSSPARGLTVHDVGGKQIADAEEDGSRGGGGEDGVLPWAGCTLELDPGNYRIRSHETDGGGVEQLIAVSRGWQTQAFIGRRETRSRGRGRRPDLAGASVLMAPVERGFDPERADLRATDLARQGLRDRRAAIPLEDMRAMVWAKRENPMLAIYGAHLMIHQPDPDMRLLSTVAENLESLVGEHPDVTALHVWLARHGGRAAPVADFTCPPMLKSSWGIVIDASAERPELVPRGSLSAEVAERVLSGAPWLRWRLAGAEHVKRAKREPAPPPEVSLGMAVAGVADAVVQSDPKGIAEQAAGASPIESSVMAYAQQVGAKAEGSTTDPGSISAADLVEALKVPRTVAEDAVQLVVKRLNLS